MPLVKMKLHQPERSRTIRTEIDAGRVKEYLKAGWEADNEESAPLPEPIREEMAKVEVDIPFNWERTHPPSKIRLAKELNPDFDGDKNAAEELIRKALAARQS